MSDDGSDTTAELERLKDETRIGGRTDTAGGETTDDPVAELVEYITTVRDGDATQSFGAKDDQIAAYLAYLSDHPETMRVVGEAAADNLARSPTVNYEQKSGIVRLLFRLGLQEAMPEHDDQLGDAIAEYARTNL
ncbi:hypothetical protein [Halococcus thailandensis]|uniref:DUF8115 domain-containing protein n=1 Tax=Halococcus thailandensis JCM 13552 TaxID=1227457 RepID=M0MV73_9EURY|nr:hypothetical protein [Halococcus thailandensis]EMA48694.1 hypothetical protein C451_20038 [Halococcus thailandensis JCM 13552]